MSSAEADAKIRAVIFDFGGVILAPPKKEHLVAWSRRLGISLSTLQEALWGKAWQALERNEIDDEAYRRQLAKALKLPDQEAVERFFEAFYADERLFPEMLDLIERLRQAEGIKVALLTNAYLGQDEVMQRKWDINPREFFDLYVNSAEVGLAKPDPEIFELTLSRLGLSPERALFIDDKVANVETAAQLGLQTLHFEGPDGLEQIVAQVERRVGLESDR